MRIPFKLQLAPEYIKQRLAAPNNSFIVAKEKNGKVKYLVRCTMSDFIYQWSEREDATVLCEEGAKLCLSLIQYLEGEPDEVYCMILM